MSELARAYIAGFLDGDGSIMLQIRPRPDCKYGFRITSTICLYQDSSHEEDLRWMCDQLGTGYVSQRNDGISEYRIDGHERVDRVLAWLQPYVRFKREQVQLMRQALALLQQAETPTQFLEVCRLADRLSEANYSSRRRYTSQTVEDNFRRQGLLSP